MFSDHEIEGFRSDTPGCNNKVHLNNAGASLMPKGVIESINDHIRLEGEIGGYEAAEGRSGEIQRFYTQAAKLLHCGPSNIAFTANATDAFSRAISAIPFQPGDVILTTNEDYISNQITYIAFARRFGTRLVRVNSLPEGGVDLDDFEDAVKKYTPKLVAVTHIPTNSGLIQPVKEIGDICKRHSAFYLVDACQSIGQLPLDVAHIGCDFLSVTSRKFLRGPRGAGFLFVSDKALDAGLEPLFIDMRGADWVAENNYTPRKGAVRFEDWEFAYALLLGTTAAIDYLLRLDMAKIESRVQQLAHYSREQLSQIDGISIHDKGTQLGGLVTFHLRGGDPDYIKQELARNNISVVTSYRNFAVIDYDEKKVGWTIRVSPHYFNTKGEIDLLVKEVEEIASRSRSSN